MKVRQEQKCVSFPNLSLTVDTLWLAITVRKTLRSERKKKRVLTRYTKMIPLHSIKAQFWSNVDLICSIFLNIDFSSDVKKAVTCERQQADRATEGPMSWFSRALGLFRTQSKESGPMNFISEMKNEKKKQNRHHRVRRHRARLGVGRLIKEVR